MRAGCLLLLIRLIRVTSSTTGVSDDLASVEREERNVRLGENSVIGTSVEGRKTSSSLSLSGKNDSRNDILFRFSYHIKFESI